MKSIFNILNQKKSESPVLRGAMAALTVEEADRVLAQIFGAQIQHYAKCLYVKEGTLAIRITGSAGATEIKLNETKIMAKINDKFGPASVRKIRYVV